MPSLTQVRRFEYQQSFKDAGFAAGMKSAADAARKMAEEARGASESVKGIEVEQRRAAPAFATVNKLIDGNAVVTAAVTKANRELEARLRSLRDEALKNADVAAVVAEKEQQLIGIRDRAIAKAEQQAEAIRKANAAATSTDDGAGPAALAARMEAVAAATARATAAQGEYARALKISAASADDSKSRAADIAAFGAELDRLRARYSPLFALQQAYRTNLLEIADANRKGAISELEAAAARQRTKDVFAEQVRTLNGLTPAAGSAGGALAALKGQAQNVGFQLQDIAVQAQAGTNALTILGQQGPQLLGGFGPAGAVAGAAIAIGAVIASVLLLTGEAKTLDEAIKNVNASFDRQTSAAGARVDGIKKEVEAVEQLRGAYVAMGAAAAAGEEAARQRANKSLNEKTDDLTRGLGGGLVERLRRRDTVDPASNITDIETLVNSGPSRGLAADIGAAVEAFRQFRDVTGPTVDGLRAYIAALDAAQKAGGANSAEIRKLRDAAIDALPSVTDLEKAYRANATQSIALRLASGESGEAIIAAANAATGAAARYAGLTTELVRTGEALNQLRRNFINDPLADVNAEASRLADRLAALNAGGKEALDRVVSQQEQQIATQTRVNAKAEEFIKVQQQLGKTEAEARALATAEMPKWELEIGRTLNLNTQLIVRTKQVEDARQAAAKAATAAATEARKAAAEEERGAKRAIDDANKLQASFDKIWTDADKKAEERVARSATAERTQDQSLERVRLETRLVGESTSTRERELAVLTERQRIVTENAGNDAALDFESSKRRIARAGEIATETSELNKQRSAMQELGQIGESAFNSISSAITQAFVQGKGAAIDFGTIAKGIIAQLAAEIVKLAVLRPILNALFNTDYATIDNLGGAASRLLGGSSGSAGASSSSGGIGLGDLSTLASGADKLSGGSLSSGIMSKLGLSNGVSGIGSSVNSLGVSSGLFGNGISPLAQGPTLSGAPLGATSQSGLLGTTTATGALGGIATGVGLGMAGGALVGGMRGSVNTTQNAAIGSVGGAVAGAIIGSVVPVIGTAIGAMIGGAIGGTGSGFFGATKKGLAQRSGGDVAYANIGGQLQIIGGGGKRWDSAAAFAEVQQQLDEINAAVSQRGLTLTGGSGMVGFGQASKNPTAVGREAIAGMLRSDNANVQTVIDTRGGKSLEELFGDIDWTRQVYEPLTATAAKTSEFQQQLNGLAAQYTPVIDKAAALGLSTVKLSEDFAKAIADFGAARNLAVNTATDAISVRLARATSGAANGAALVEYDNAMVNGREAWKAQLEAWGLDAADVALRINIYERAAGAERVNIARKAAEAMATQLRTVWSSGASLAARNWRADGNSMVADLIDFDVSAANQRASLATTLADNFASVEETTSQIALLETVLGKERLAIITDANKKISDAEASAADDRRRQATGVVQGLSSYVSGLRTRADSPLSETAQYFGAASDFRSINARAQAGDGDALAGLTKAADTFLASSRTIYGSGTNYARDFADVIDSIGKIAARSPDELTAAIYASEMRTQTQILNDAIDLLRAEVAGLKTELRLNGAAPARAA